jgi:hypothetical protein
MSGVNDQLKEEFNAGLKQARKEREAEWEEVKKQFPINPDDPPEKQHEMWIKQQAAMLDP